MPMPAKRRLPSPITTGKIIDRSLCMVVVRPDASGQPLSPVYYTPYAYRDFFWVSQPDATQSVNLVCSRSHESS
jgi:hypothetical protein